MFGTVNVLRRRLCLENGADQVDVRLSEMNALMCSSKYHDAPCDGGWAAFDDIRTQGGVVTEKCVPY